MTLESESPLMKFIKNQNMDDIPELLPLIHTTKPVRLREIVQTNRLPAQVNEKTRQKEFCFFYGRPAYHSETKPASEPVSEDETTLFPICLVFELVKPADIYAIYPFNSGDFRNKVYVNYIDPNSDIKNFSLGTDYEIVSRFVSAFFGGNRKYYHGAIKEQLNFGFFDLEAKQYYGLARASRTAHLDDRRYTLEIQFDHDLEIDDHPKRRPVKKKSPTAKPGYREKGSEPDEVNWPNLSLRFQMAPLKVAAAILPYSALDDPQIISAVNKWEAEVLPYEQVNGRSSDYYQEEVFFKLREFYEGRQLIELENKKRRPKR